MVEEDNRSTNNTTNPDYIQLIPYDSYPFEKAHQRSTIKWLLIKSTTSAQEDHHHYNTQDYQSQSQQPFYTDDDGLPHLKPFIVKGLSTGELYSNFLYHTLYKDPNYAQLNPWGIVQLLIRKSIYITNLTETILIQSTPLRINSHLILIEGLIQLYLKETLRNVLDYEEMLLTWLNGIVIQLKDDYKKRNNENSIRLTNYSPIKLIQQNQQNNKLSQKQLTNLLNLKSYQDLIDLSDGVGLCLLLVYLNVINIDTIIFPEPGESLNITEAVSNLELVIQYLNSLGLNIFEYEDLLYVDKSIRLLLVWLLAEFWLKVEKGGSSGESGLKNRINEVNPVVIGRNNNIGQQQQDRSIRSRQEDYFKPNRTTMIPNLRPTLYSSLKDPPYKSISAQSTPIKRERKNLHTTIDSYEKKVAAAGLTRTSVGMDTIIVPIGNKTRMASGGGGTSNNDDKSLERFSSMKSTISSSSNSSSTSAEQNDFQVHKRRQPTSTAAAAGLTSHHRTTTVSRNYPAGLPSQPTSTSAPVEPNLHRKRISRSNSLTEIDSQLTIENFGGSNSSTKQTVDWLQRNPMKELVSLDSSNNTNTGPVAPTVRIVRKQRRGGGDEEEVVISGPGGSRDASLESPSGRDYYDNENYPQLQQRDDDYYETGSIRGGGSDYYGGSRERSVPRDFGMSSRNSEYGNREYGREPNYPTTRPRTQSQSESTYRQHHEQLQQPYYGRHPHQADIQPVQPRTRYPDEQQHHHQPPPQQQVHERRQWGPPTREPINRYYEQQQQRSTYEPRAMSPQQQNTNSLPRHNNNNSPYNYDQRNPANTYPTSMSEQTSPIHHHQQYLTNFNTLEHNNNPINITYLGQQQEQQQQDYTEQNTGQLFVDSEIEETTAEIENLRQKLEEKRLAIEKLRLKRVLGGGKLQQQGGSRSTGENSLSSTSSPVHRSMDNSATKPFHLHNPTVEDDQDEPAPIQSNQSVSIPVPPPRVKKQQKEPSIESSSMEPQQISFITQEPNRITSGTKTYRISTPESSLSPKPTATAWQQLFSNNSQPNSGQQQGQSSGGFYIDLEGQQAAQEESTETKPTNSAALILIDQQDDIDNQLLLEKKKQRILLQSLKRQQEAEELKRQKEYEFERKRLAEEYKTEEKLRKKEEEKLRREKILEEYRLKKCNDNDLPMEQPSNNSTWEVQVKKRPKSAGIVGRTAGGGSGRPKTIHVGSTGGTGGGATDWKSIQRSDSQSSLSYGVGGGANQNRSRSRSATRSGSNPPPPTNNRNVWGSTTSLTSNAAANQRQQQQSKYNRFGQRSISVNRLNNLSRTNSQENFGGGGGGGGYYFGGSNQSLYNNNNERRNNNESSSAQLIQQQQQHQRSSTTMRPTQLNLTATTKSKLPQAIKQSPNITTKNWPSSLQQRVAGNYYFDDGASDISSVSRYSTEASGRIGAGAGGLAGHQPSNNRFYYNKSHQNPAGNPTISSTTTKSNRSIILNAVEYSIFPGLVNAEQKQRVLNEINNTDCKYFLIMFRDAGCQFRAIYACTDDELIIKLYGIGPKYIEDDMFDKFFKYNSGAKCFNVVHTKHLTVTIDAFTIHNSLWTGKKVGGGSRPTRGDHHALVI